MEPFVAREIATVAHMGQLDKAGRPYIEHPARVAALVAHGLGQSHPAVAVAWLHDVVEDTEVGFDQIESQLTPDQRTALDALTHQPGEPREHYIDRVKQHPWAASVKRADIADNSDPSRLALLDDATRERLLSKYARDLAQLSS
jgi:(p)ppGpp synthase/HD superfamily hydrolase